MANNMNKDDIVERTHPVTRNRQFSGSRQTVMSIEYLLNSGNL